jgi:UDP-3-O-[3-hydroxymyristoyl] glucosamine N-acyltransferase
VIGADGFGYLTDPRTGITKVPQVGVVKIGDHVEIGASASIDRGTVGATIIGSHVKIDNQVQIGHNVRVDSHCIICAQAGIAGSCHIQRGVVLGGGAGVADHVTIVPGVRVGGHAGVISSIDEPGDYMGFPAMKAPLYRRQQAFIRRLTNKKSVKTPEP